MKRGGGGQPERVRQDLLLLKQAVNFVTEVGRRHQTCGNMSQYVYNTVHQQECDYVSCRSSKLLGMDIPPTHCFLERDHQKTH